MQFQLILPDLETLVNGNYVRNRASLDGVAPSSLNQKESNISKSKKPSANCSLTWLSF